MLQGQGIIDIVNTYFQILLQYGVVGLALYIGMFASAFWPLWRAVSAPLPNELRGLVAIFCAGFLSFMIMMGTTSDVGHLGSFAIILTGFGQAVTNLVTSATSALRVSPQRGFRPHARNQMASS
jgi:O-antigen ligase